MAGVLFVHIFSHRSSTSKRGDLVLRVGSRAGKSGSRSYWFWSRLTFSLPSWNGSRSTSY